MGNCVRRELGVEFDDDTEIYEGEAVMEERMTAIRNAKMNRKEVVRKIQEEIEREKIEEQELEQDDDKIKSIRNEIIKETEEPESIMNDIKEEEIEEDKEEDPMRIMILDKSKNLKQDPEYVKNNLTQDIQQIDDKKIDNSEDIIYDIDQNKEEEHNDDHVMDILKMKEEDEINEEPEEYQEDVEEQENEDYIPEVIVEEDESPDIKFKENESENLEELENEEEPEYIQNEEIEKEEEPEFFKIQEIHMEIEDPKVKTEENIQNNDKSNNSDEYKKMNTSPNLQPLENEIINVRKESKIQRPMMPLTVKKTVYIRDTLDKGNYYTNYLLN